MTQNAVLAAIQTETTCGAACWMALEDICRCSCGGRNHGVLRSANGVQPTRTRKIDGHVYTLLAVEAPDGSCRAVSMGPIQALEREIVNAAVAAGSWSRYAWASTPGYPIKVKTAAAGEVDRWPELAAWREGSKWYPWRPLVAWIRSDLQQEKGE